MSPGFIIALFLLAVSLTSLCLFVAGAMDAAAASDEADEALIASLMQRGDERLSDVMKTPVQPRGE